MIIVRKSFSIYFRQLEPEPNSINIEGMLRVKWFCFFVNARFQGLEFVLGKVVLRAFSKCSVN